MKKIGRILLYLLLAGSTPFVVVGLIMYFTDGYDGTSLAIAGFFAIPMVLSILGLRKSKNRPIEVAEQVIVKPNTNETETGHQTIIYQTAEQQKKVAPAWNAIVCPHIQLWDAEANYKSKKTRTSLNLNPLHPFTVFNSKEVKKEKKSAGKIALAVATGGTSALITGTKDKRHHEYYCADCGNHWIGK